MAKKTVKRVYENSAIGSWAGYIYQGLCGLFHCLKMIAEDREKYKGYKLYLDSYEDFAIMNDVGKLVSLHQCKDEKNVTDYSLEYKKMKMKLKILSGECTPACKLYFHTNKIVKGEKGIVMYPFTESQNFSEPGELISLIKDQVKALLPKDQATVQKVVCSLEVLIEQKVLEVHHKYVGKNNIKPLRDLAKDFAYIDFQTILDKLYAEEEVFTYDRNSYIGHIRYKLINDLDDICNDEDKDDISAEQIEHISFLKERLQSLNIDEMETFLKRVHPIDNLSNRSVGDFANVSAKGKVISLFNIVSELEQLDDDLSWNAGKGKETPTSLNKDWSVATLCKKIIRNKTNNDSLYEYDWLVGDVRETVDDIGTYLPPISDVESKSKDGRSIFETKKVGLVCKQDKIDGKY